MQDDTKPVVQHSLWRRAWEGWKRFAHVIGVFNTRLIMTLLYFVVVLPTGLIVRVVSDPLRLYPPKDTNWVPVQQHPRSLRSAQDQF